MKGQRWALYLPYLRGVQGYGFLPRGSDSSSGLPYTLGFEKMRLCFDQICFIFGKLGVEKKGRMSGSDGDGTKADA